MAVTVQPLTDEQNHPSEAIKDDPVVAELDNHSPLTLPTAPKLDEGESIKHKEDAKLEATTLLFLKSEEETPSPAQKKIEISSVIGEMFIR